MTNASLEIGHVLSAHEFKELVWLVGEWVEEETTVQTVIDRMNEDIITHKKNILNTEDSIKTLQKHKCKLELIRDKTTPEGGEKEPE